MRYTSAQFKGTGLDDTSKVTQLGRHPVRGIRCHQDVVRFDVGMQQPKAMQELQGQGRVLEDDPDENRRQFFALSQQKSVQVIPRILQDQVDLIRHNAHEDVQQLGHVLETPAAVEDMRLHKRMPQMVWAHLDCLDGHGLAIGAPPPEVTTTEGTLPEFVTQTVCITPFFQLLPAGAQKQHWAGA